MDRLQRPSEFNADDRRWLAAAAHLGMRGRPSSAPNPAVGAIIVANGVVIGRGWTQPGGRPHAEAMALAQAGAQTGAQAGIQVRGATLYTTLEPCAHQSPRGPTCSAAIAEAGIARVVFGRLDPDPRTAGQGVAALRKAGVKVPEPEDCGSGASLAGYLFQRIHGRPHVTLKIAMSLDGFIARPDGESRWITGETARAHVHSRRAMADAILVGGGTWRTDRPRLDVRLPGLEDRSPARIILTRGIAPDGVKIINTPSAIANLSGVQYLYVEGGGGAAASFLQEGLVDRIDIYRAPILLGSGIGALADYGLPALADAHGAWTLVERRTLGSDTYEAYERTASSTAAQTVSSPNIGE